MIRNVPPEQFLTTWVDGGREPQRPANPAYPDGVDIVAVLTGDTGCRVALPYPAARIGHHVLRCHRCGVSTMVSTAGRADDPRSVAVTCKNLPTPIQTTRPGRRRSG